MCVFSSHLFGTSSSLDVPAEITQEEAHTGFLIYLPSAVRALNFLTRRIQPFLSLVEREVEFCVPTIFTIFNRSPFVGHFFIPIFMYFLVRENPVYRDSNSRPNVAEGYEVTSELPGRPTLLWFFRQRCRYGTQ